MIREPAAQQWQRRQRRRETRNGSEGGGFTVARRRYPRDKRRRRRKAGGSRKGLTSSGREEKCSDPGEEYRREKRRYCNPREEWRNGWPARRSRCGDWWRAEEGVGRSEDGDEVSEASERGVHAGDDEPGGR